MGLDITFCKLTRTHEKDTIFWYLDEPQVLYFRKRYDILKTIQDIVEDRALEGADIGCDAFILNKNDINKLVANHWECIPLSQYDELIVWWVS